MSDKDFVEQWVVLAREGNYEVNGQRWTITKNALIEMAMNFNQPLPIWPNAECLGPEGPFRHGATRLELVAVEVRKDARGSYLAGMIRSPDICISFVDPARNRQTGATVGARVNDVIFTHKKISPIERASDPLKSESEAPVQTPHSQ
jgi:hypothetical protein